MLTGAGKPCLFSSLDSRSVPNPKVAQHHVYASIPGPTNVGVLFIYDKLNILTQLLDLICHQDARHTATYGEDFELAVLGVSASASATKPSSLVWPLC